MRDGSADIPSGRCPLGMMPDIRLHPTISVSELFLLTPGLGHIRADRGGRDREKKKTLVPKRTFFFVTPPERCHENREHRRLTPPRRQEKCASHNPNAVVDMTREERDDTSWGSGHTGRRRGILDKRKDGRQGRIPPEWNPRGLLAFFCGSMVVFPKSGMYRTAFRTWMEKTEPLAGRPAYIRHPGSRNRMVGKSLKNTLSSRLVKNNEMLGS